MYIYKEDNDKKILRIAKRNAYGACDRHKGHWDWDTFWGTCSLGFIVLIVVGLVCYKHGKSVGKSEINYNAHIALDCIDTTSKETDEDFLMLPDSSITLAPNTACTAKFLGIEAQ